MMLVYTTNSKKSSFQHATEAADADMKPKLVPGSASFTVRRMREGFQTLQAGTRKPITGKERLNEV